MFVTREDVLAVLHTLEQRVAIKYTLADWFSDSNAAPSWGCASDIPNLGVAQKGKQMLEAIYLISPRDVDVVSRRIEQRSGVAVYAIDQAYNPESITLRVGGVFGDKAVIAGQCGTASEHEWSVAMFGKLKRAMAKQCRNVKGIFVGPEAQRLGRSGYRLTGSIGRSTEYDLVLE